MKKFLFFQFILFSSALFSSGVNTRFQLLDALLQRNPAFVHEVVQARKNAEELKADAITRGVIEDPESYLASAKDHLIKPIKRFLEDLYDFQDKMGLKDMVQESLTKDLPKEDESYKSSVIMIFFGAKRAEVDDFFYKNIHTIEEMKRAIEEFSKFTDHFLNALSKDTMRSYAIWRKDKKAKEDKNNKPKQAAG